jgi:sugar lactone lactonase YvrE
MDAGAITTSGETFANSDTQIPTNAAVRNWVLTTYPTIVELNDLTANVTWATVPDAYISASSVNQHVSVEKATQSKTYTNGEVSELTLSESITSGVPVVSVTKEVAQTGLTNNNWDVATDGTNYDLEDSAYATTLTPSDASADGTFTLGSGSFAADDVGKIVSGNGGTAIVLNTDGDYNLLTDFDDTSAIASGSWTLKEMLVDGAATGFALANGNLIEGSTVYDLNVAYKTGKTFSVSSENTDAKALAFNSDGTKMYYLGANTDETVYQYTLSTAFDITTASYDSVSFNTEGTGTNSVVFSTDGTKMYTLSFEGGGPDDLIYQYSLSTAFDLSTASYDSVSFNVSTEEAVPLSLRFKTDGTKMFVCGQSGNDVTEYSLSTAWDISTASATGNTLNASHSTYHQAFTTSADGIHFYVADENPGSTINIWHYVLLTPWDVSTGSLFRTYTAFDSSTGLNTEEILFVDNESKLLNLNGAGTITEYSLSPLYNLKGLNYTGRSFSVSSQDTSPKEVAFNTDGTKMYVLGSSNDSIYQYSLTTGFDVNTASYDSVSFDVSSQEASPTGFTFNNDGTKMYIVGAGNDTVYQYSLSTAFDLSTASYDSVSFSVSSQAPLPHQVIFNNDGTKMYVIDANTATIYQYSLSTAFDLSTASYDSVSLSVSGQDSQGRSIAFNSDGTTLFFFGNANENVHQYSLSTAYDLSTATYLSITLSVLSAEGGGEGIVFNNNGSKMFLVGSSGDAVYEFDTQNMKIGKWSGEVFNVSAQESSAQGLAFSSDGTKMYLCGANGQSVFEYDLSTAFDLSTASYNSVSFSIASQDTILTSVEFKTDGTIMYVCGTNTDTVYQYTLSTAWDISTASYASISYSVATETTAPNGMAFSTNGTEMYIVDDISNRIIQYNLSTAWNVSTASYSGIAYTDGIAAQPYGLTFSSDGYKMYVNGRSSDALNEHTLTTAWDLSTASYDGFNFNIGRFDGNSSSLAFNTDRSKVFFTGWGTNKVYEINIGSTQIITPVVYSSDYAVAVTNSSGQVDSTYFTDINSTTTTESVGTGEAYYAYSVDDHVTWKVIHDTDGERSIARNNSGTWEYNSNGTYGSETWTSATTNSEVGALKQAMEGATTIAGQFDVSNASYSQSFSVASQDTGPQGVTFNTDGTKMFVVGTLNDSVYEYTLSTGFDVSTSSYSQSFSVTSQETNPAGIAFNTDGTKMFITGSSSNNVNEYTLSTGFDISTASYSQNFSVASQEADPYAIAFNNDGTKMFITGVASDNVSEYTLSTGFDVSTATYSQNFSVNAEEINPYGITFNNDGTKMFITGISGDDVNEYTLSTGFDVSTASYSQNFSVASQDTAPKSVCFNTDGSKMFIAGDNGNSIYEYNVSTTSYPNQMTGTQFDAVTDANHLTLSTTMDFMIALKNADSTSTSPTSDGVSFNYDAASLNQGAVLGTDYNWDFPALNKVRITSLADQNLKVRVI